MLRIKNEEWENKYLNAMEENRKLKKRVKELERREQRRYDN